ncbi:MAG: hypothetical protein ACJ77A_05380 [Actinomycetota bacterium]
MMRKWAVGVLAGVAVLALAVPAQAKGDVSQVTVTNAGGSGSGGPGIGGPGSGGSGSGSGGSGGGGTAPAVLTAPMHLQGVDASGWIADTGIFQESQIHPAASTLGPALDARVAYSCGAGGDGVLSQQLYPYAKGGAVAHTPAGQQFCDGGLPQTWWRIGDTTMSVLHENGLPATMPGVAQPAAGSAAGAGAGGSAAHGAATGAGSAGGASVFPLVLGLSAVMAIGGFALMQARRRRTVAA